LWPQTEALRAALVMARGGDDAAADYAATLIDALFASYLAQDMPGLWCDEYDADGRAIAKDVPASILYHIHEAVCCAAECRHKIT
jgi:mannose/cellobiose epimerase-like protein (N-acyl-D-glucosamine 2-epimerase family)